QAWAGSRCCRLLRAAFSAARSFCCQAASKACMACCSVLPASEVKANKGLQQRTVEVAVKAPATVEADHKFGGGLPVQAQQTGHTAAGIVFAKSPAGPARQGKDQLAHIPFLLQAQLTQNQAVIIAAGQAEVEL